MAGIANDTRVRVGASAALVIALLGLVGWGLANRERPSDAAVGGPRDGAIGSDASGQGRKSAGGAAPALPQRDSVSAGEPETPYELLRRLMDGYYALPAGAARDTYVAGVAAFLGNRRPMELVSAGIAVGGAGEDGPRELAPDEVAARLKNRIETTDPLDRARAIEFMKAVRARLERN